MNLYYLHLGLDYYDYIESNNDLRYEFQKHTNFIDDYFSKEIRKLKLKTDGTFKMIAISPTEFEIKKSSVVPDKALKVNLSFNKKRYEQIKATEDCSYYLELLEEGFKKANDYKKIHLQELLNVIQKFKDNDCKNEWQHKKKRSKSDDLEVILNCEFTTNHFQLVAIINQISTKKELAKGVVMRTDTGSFIHEGMYKNILIDKDIIVTNGSDKPIIKINKKAALKGELKFKILGDKEIKEILSYGLDI
ncbi:hypothetical protein [Tenacibaculum amylolyticum]|uniref:hypothetical protein n=1 Tax=Tenacibaculum amylolyticum TaxID=104269 RepID=UPI003894C611